MFTTPEELASVSHPFISSMHLKKDFGKGRRAEDVLVIETCFPDLNDDGHTGVDSYLMDLLSDLEELKTKAENYVGTFDRVDIRTR